MAEKSSVKVTTYLTFNLGEETFAVDVGNVREVLEMVPVTKVPRTPEFLRGVINLRGSVVPVVDMRLKFGLPAKEDTIDTCVVVLEVELDGEVTVIGAVADSVREVFDLPADQVEPPPRIGTRLDTQFIRGMARHEDRFIIILETAKVFSTEEIALAGAVQAAEGAHLPEAEARAPGGTPLLR